jgi:hypothetical protein
VTAWLLRHGERAILVAINVLAIGTLLGAAAIVAATCSGCGASALTSQAHAARILATTVGTAGTAIDAARSRSLDAVEEAHPQRGPERDAALDAEAERWRPIGQALDSIRSALITWLAALEAARVVGDTGTAALWPQILALGGQALALYASIADLARELGADVPALSLDGLLGGAQ